MDPRIPDSFPIHSMLRLAPAMIHPTAIIHPSAQLDSTAIVGPYAVIDEHVEVRAHCRIGPHVHLTGHTTIGASNDFFTGCVIGGAPQDVHYRGEPTRLRVGDNNVFREHVTVHRSNREDEETIIGSEGLLMAHCHVGHNARLGDRVVLANGALIGGHADVRDQAFVSGNCLVHQFTRVGRLALMQGGSGISKDLPPFCVARGNNGICGLNSVGLRRAGFTLDQRMELKRLYHALFRAGLDRRAALSEARKQFHSELALEILDFVSSSKRGVCTDTGKRRLDPE